MDQLSQIDSSAFENQQQPLVVDETKKMLYEIRVIPTFKNREYKGAVVHNPNQRILDTILEYVNKGTVNKNGILQIIQKDQNELSSFVVKNLIDKGIINEDDLRGIGVTAIFIEMLYGSYEPVTFDKPGPIERINKESTEVYFWGIPSSGKTCAIGSILSTLSNLGGDSFMIKDNDCQGYDYMNRLSSIFNDKSVTILPEGTPVTATYEMAFDFHDNTHIYHPITMIDLAGELIRCMYKSDSDSNNINKNSLNDDELKTLETITNLLVSQTSKNQKIHVFVMEYGAKDRKYEGLTQREYLDGAMNYIERTGIFKKNTDSIILLVTKADKAGFDINTQRTNISKYIQENYRNFYNALKYICESNEINDGKLITKFISLGEVCFQDYCYFSNTYAKDFVEMLLAQSFTKDKSRQGLFKRWLGR